MDRGMQPMQIVTELSGKFADENRAFQGIPTIVRTPGGKLLAAWYSGGVTENGENFVLLYESSDLGESWRPVLAVSRDDDVRAFDPDLWVDPQKRVWLFWAQCDGRTPDGRLNAHDGREGVWCIRWEDYDTAPDVHSQPRRIADGIMMNKPLVRSDGAWLMPCALWITCMRDTQYDLPEQKYSNVYISEDAGETFRLYGHSAWEERDIDEHILVEKRDGSLWMLIRGRSVPHRDVPWEELPDGSRRLHFHGGIGESFSYDGGKTWSKCRDSGFGGPCSRFFIGRLASGRLLLVNHFLFSGRNRLTAMLSDNDGYSWKGFLMLDERANVSYPDVTQCPDGTLCIIYDRERYKDKEILMAKLREEDILAGECICEGSKLRMIVNQARGTR